MEMFQDLIASRMTTFKITLKVPEMSKLAEDAEADTTGITFQSHAAEGDNLAKQGSFSKAIEAYSKVGFY
jgi:hypothetical protein